MVTKIYGSTPYRRIPLGGSTNDQDSKKSEKKPNRRTFLKIATVGTGLASVGAGRALAAEPIKNEISRSGKAPPSPQKVFDHLVENKILPTNPVILKNVREGLDRIASRNPQHPLAFLNSAYWLKESHLLTDDQFNVFMNAPDLHKVSIATVKLETDLTIKKKSEAEIKDSILKYFSYFKKARDKHDEQLLVTVNR